MSYQYRNAFRAIIPAFLFLVLAAIACGGGSTEEEAVSTADPVPENAVEISMWTNDTKAEWVREVTDLFNEAEHKTTGGKPIWVHVDQSDSGDVLPMLQRGEIEPTIWSPGESSWVNEANVVWSDLHGRPLTSGDCPEVVFTAIGISMWQPMAEAMGWPDQPIGWEEIIALASDPEGWDRYGHPEWGQFKFGHTHPGASNTGLLAMSSMVYARLGITEDLTPELVRSQEVVDAFRQIEQITYHYGTSTRILSIKTAERGPAYLHAYASSEISVLATNFYQHDLLRWPLVFIFPKEGAFWSNNPVCIVEADWVGVDEREAAGIYRDFLMGPEAQGLATEEWLRPMDPRFVPDELRAEWPNTDITITREDVPPLESVSGETVEAIRDVFLQTKKPATVFILIDVSGSMGGEKIKNARDGTAGFLRLLQKDDEVHIFTFESEMAPIQPSGRVGDHGETLVETIGGIKSGGNTALYDALCETMVKANLSLNQSRASNASRLFGVVVLSDGLDTSSSRKEAEMLACLPPGEDADGIKIFTIAYGNDADEDLLERIADQSNGRFYKSDPENIADVYERISFEQ